jgi:peptidylprolyl isomerase
VPPSRRRERELARRRYERRRQAELERRAKAKRRNTVIGSITGVVVVIGVILALVFTVFTGGGGKSSVKTANSPSAGPSVSPTTPVAAPKRCKQVKPNPPAKGEPKVPDVTGKAPKKLVKKDITVGSGRAAQNGDALTVKYVGVSCSTGKVFDASYTDPVNPTTHEKAFTLTLGAGQVIKGWDKGLVGIRPGGVRELVIPAKLGYGAAGQPPKIQPNETLIFVVTAVSVKPGASPSPTTSPT